MWMSNTATTAMMIPIVESTLEVLTKGESTEGDKEVEVEPQTDQEKKNGDAHHAEAAAESVVVDRKGTILK